ncbi:MAG TPA: site-specific DNA-methyltransferase [Tissierellia bacterium]|nr:site-specific DNA-methyltransferase [Tissierellia bacterium]
MNKFEKVPEGVFNKVEHNKQEFINKFIDDLEGLFPETVKDGIVDFQALLDRFGEYEESNKIEKYNMTWVGKRQAIKEADKDIVGRTLKYVEEDSKNPETTENIYIEGDNLEVLKLLRQSYYGKIKMIYIDPPYNTGKGEFVYKDYFTLSKEIYDKLSGNVDKYGERLVKSNKDSGRYHSNWLNMMYPRLKVARDLLTDDGVIFISIDDNEVHNLRKICDEIFGEENLLLQQTINKSSQIATEFTVNMHEYILVYCKNIVQFELGNDYKYTISRGTVGNEDQTTPKIKFPKGLSCYGIKDGIYKETRKIEGSKENIYNYDNIVVKNGKLGKDVVLQARWRSSNDMRNFFDNNCKPTRAKINGVIEEIYFENDRFVPQIKKRIKKKINSVNFNNKRGSKYLEELELNIFDNPKDMEVIKKIIRRSSYKDSIILDFFSGSATTAHAVMDLNAEDGGNRKYIMVQLPEPTDEKSEAHKAGYKNICEIGKERIRRAGDKIKEELKEKYNSANEEERKSMKNPEDLDIGFKVFKVEDTNLKRIKDTVKEGISMEEHKAISPKDNKDFNPHFTDIDVVYEMMLKRQDIDLNEEIILLDDIGERTYLVGYTMLICLEEEVTEEMVEKIGSLDVDLSWIIMRDSAFGNNINLKLNTVNKLRTIVKENHRKEQKIYWI